MAWEGYFSYGGTEIINASRTEAYAKHLNAGWFKPVYNQPDLAWLLGEPNYATPLQDDAPWCDPDNLDSFDFLGVYPLNVEGIEDSTVAATITESVIDGGYIGRTRKGTRAIVFTTVLSGLSACAVEYGMRWLRNVLNGSPCFGASYGVCGGADLCYLACPPLIGDPDPTLSPGPIVLDKTNLVTNPNLEASSAGWNSNDPARFTITRSTVSPISGTGSMLSTRIGTLDGDVASFYVAGASGALNSLPVTPGVPLTMSVDVKTERPNRRFLASFAWVDAANAVIGYTPVGPPTEPASGQVARVTATQTPPANAAYALVIVGTYALDGNAVAGERVWADNLLLEQASTPSAYFDGSTSAKGDYSYAWTGAANASTSQRFVQTYVADPLPTAEDCYDKVGRSMHGVTTTVGPNVVKKMDLIDGGAAWTVTWTLVAANPAEFGVEKPLIVGFLDPAVDIPYYGGVVPDGGLFDEDGYVQTETKCPAPIFTPVFDPTCALLQPPPDVPTVVPMCFSFPVNYTRRSFTIPQEKIPLWTEVVPVLQITTKQDESRNVRIRFYADTFGTGTPAADPCNYCGDLVVSYVPPSATLVLNGMDQSVYIDQPGQGRRRADALVTNSDGEPFDWPQFSCGFGYVVTVDTPQQVKALPVVDLSLVSRII